MKAWVRRFRRAWALAGDSAKLNEAQLSSALRYGDDVMRAANLSRQRRRAIFREAAQHSEKLSDLVVEIVRAAVKEAG